MKRASQLAAEEKSSLVEELGKLLETVSFGAQGRLKPEDEGDFS